MYKKKEDYGKMMDMLCSYIWPARTSTTNGMAMLSEYAQSFTRNRVEILNRYF